MFTFAALPRPPTNLRVSDVSQTSVKLTWNYPRGRDGVPRDVQYFVIQYKPKLASWDYKEISGAITTFYDIRGLSPYTEYEFVVLAKNNVGRGPKSDPVVVTTGEKGKLPALKYSTRDEIFKGICNTIIMHDNNFSLTNNSTSSTTLTLQR